VTGLQLGKEEIILPFSTGAKGFSFPNSVGTQALTQVVQ
jgi:hypothetical protein